VLDTEHQQFTLKCRNPVISNKELPAAAPTQESTHFCDAAASNYNLSLLPCAVTTRGGGGV